MNNKVLVVEDDPDLRDALSATLANSGIEVCCAEHGEAALTVLAGEPVALVLSDVQMDCMGGFDLLREVRNRHADLPVLLMTAYGSVPQAVQAMREGASDYLIKPFEAEVLVGKVASYLGGDSSDSAVISEDSASRELLALAARVAQSEVTVMLTGESGTGKEVIARHIHRLSRRAQKPFVAINCAAIPDNMLEAMLFGYEKGAFTGAYKACPGKFEQAQGGTLLLDEISEMDLGLQAKLLRVLQEREVERLGGRETIALDVRVLTTSNRDMREQVRAGRFREDLYYRLNVFPLHLPALRERPADIVPLAEHLLGRAVRATGRCVPTLSIEATVRLRGWSWPGNVRELDNVLQRALVLGDGDIIDAALLHMEGISVGDAQDEEGALDSGVLDNELKEREAGIILEALRASGGNRKVVAERLGISPRTLRYKLARMRDAGVALP